MYVYIFQGESIEAAASSISINHARIAVMISDVNHEIFVVCEQKPLCKVPSLEEGIFIAFAAYYIFNLEYPKEIRGLMTFLQDYILQVTDNLKRNASYLSISTDINNYAS